MASPPPPAFLSLFLGGGLAAFGGLMLWARSRRGSHNLLADTLYNMWKGNGGQFSRFIRYPAEVAGLVLVDPPTEWQHLTEERARLLRRAIQASHIGGALARVGVVRGCLALLTGGAPGVPRNFVPGLGPRALRTLEHLVGEARKLPPEIHPAVQALWCEPKCFRAMAEHLAARRAIARAAAEVTSLGVVPLAIVSGGDQPAEVLAQHRQLTRLSPQGRQIVAAKSGHWAHLDEPAVVVSAIRDMVERARSRQV